MFYKRIGAFFNVCCAIIIIDVLVFYGGYSYAITIELKRDSASVCRIYGLVEHGDLLKIQEFTESHKCFRVELDSPGGDFDEAIGIMEHLHSSMIETSVASGESCLSACAIMWLGGARAVGRLDEPEAWRLISPGATLGFHAPYPKRYRPGMPPVPPELFDRDFVVSFATAQKLLVLFDRRKIPLWFAAKLMHPDVSDYFYIDTVEKALLVGANFGDYYEEKYSDDSFPVDSKVLAQACYNLGAWGKRIMVENIGREAGEFSASYASFDEYWDALQSGHHWQRDHWFLWGVSAFLDSVYPSSANNEAVTKLLKFLNDHAVDDKFRDVKDGDVKGKWSIIVSEVGQPFKLEAPSFLGWADSGSYTNDDKYFLFFSPGIRGPDDEITVLERSELCLISPTRKWYWGTEFDGDFFDGIPTTFLGMPVGSRLLDVPVILKERANIMGDLSK